MYARYTTKVVHIAHADARGATVDASFDLSTPLSGRDADGTGAMLRRGPSLVTSSARMSR